MSLLFRLARDPRGAGAAEFALVLPLLLLFIFGIIDVGRLMWTWNRAEKATQMGVRFAVVTDTVATGLNENFVTEYGLVGGDPVPLDTFSSTTCDMNDCSGGWGHDAAAFQRIVERMNLIDPTITASNVVIEYENVGLGFAGDPSSPDVAALVTVSLRDLDFQPLLLFGGSVTLPDFRAALTIEDGSGTASN